MTRLLHEIPRRSPGGCNSGARLIFAPDREPVTWTEAERARGQAWGLATIPSSHTHGTPPRG
jgi:catechol 2,3-dioxygenase